MQGTRGPGRCARPTAPKQPRKRPPPSPIREEEVLPASPAAAELNARAKQAVQLAGAAAVLR